MNRTFYSNCLLEALKAKVKDWKNVRILYVPQKYNTDNACHFMWRNIKSDELFDFKADGKSRAFFNLVLFKGHIRQIEVKDYYEKFMNNQVTNYLKKKYRAEERRIEKRFGYISTNSSIEFCNYWQEMWHYISDNETPTTNDDFGNLVEVLVQDEDAVSINLMEIDEHGFVSESKKKIICWRYFKSADIEGNIL